MEEHIKQPLLKIDNVSMNYGAKDGDTEALESIFLDINVNEFVCILGPSGCGKSSLLNIIAGFLEPTSGNVYLEGEKIQGIDWHRGVVFQQPNLYEWYSVKDNINYGLRMRKVDKNVIEKKTQKMLETMDLTEFANKKVYELSGGMKQRVGIARALINDPDILLMDEPFSALDALTKEQMQNFTRRIWNKSQKTFMLITHDVDEALKLATRIVVLSGRPGRIIHDANYYFTSEFIHSNSYKVIYSEEYYRKRNELLELIGIKEN